MTGGTTDSRPIAGRAVAAGPRFDVAVGPNGYCWWYLDGLSDDGRHGVTVILFIGSVFSPYYAAARRRGPADPEDFVSVNVCLYGPGGNRWTMTERRRHTVTRDGGRLAIGPSAVDWDGTALTVALDERGTPIPRRVRGQVRVVPDAVTPAGHDLTADGRHRWWPIAPAGRIEVALQQPALRWTGSGYLDSNGGDGPLEQAFHSWDWSRTPLPDGAAVLYDGLYRAADDGPGERFTLALRFDRAGGVTRFEPPGRAALPGTLWRIARTTRTDPGSVAAVGRTLEDTPFYARSELRSHLCGAPVMAMHESLDLNRFRSPLVQGMLRCRMPRVWW